MTTNIITAPGFFVEVPDDVDVISAQDIDWPADAKWPWGE